MALVPECGFHQRMKRTPLSRSIDRKLRRMRNDATRKRRTCTSDNPRIVHRGRVFCDGLLMQHAEKATLRRRGLDLDKTYASVRKRLIFRYFLVAANVETQYARRVCGRTVTQ
jgi:hypothetical protein